MKNEKKPKNDESLKKNPKDSSKELSDDDLSKVSGGAGSSCPGGPGENNHYDDSGRTR